jgi:hypothetical protein
VRNLAFVIWMLGWSLLSTISSYLQYLTKKTYSEETELFAAIIMIIIWIWIGKLLYEPCNNK